MASTLVGRLMSFCVGFGVASVLGAKVVYDESRKSMATLHLATKALADRIAVVEAKQQQQQEK